MGVIPARSGGIDMGGNNVVAMKSYQRVERGLAYVPQGRMIFPALTVRRISETGLEVTGSKRIPEDIFALFPVLYDMRSRKGRQPGLVVSSSSGWRLPERWLPTQVLLFDEPTEGIQPSIIKQLARPAPVKKNA